MLILSALVKCHKSGIYLGVLRRRQFPYKAVFHPDSCELEVATEALPPVSALDGHFACNNHGVAIECVDGAVAKIPSIVDQVRRPLQLDGLGSAGYLALEVDAGVALGQMLDPPAGAALEACDAHFVFQLADGLDIALVAIRRSGLTGSLSAKQKPCAEKGACYQFSELHFIPPPWAEPGPPIPVLLADGPGEY